MTILNILNEEMKALKTLYDTLIKQNKIILNNDKYLLEAIIEELKINNKEVARLEMDRIKVLNGQKISDVAATNDELNGIIKEIHKLIKLIYIQRDTNSILIKQKLYFNNKLLSILSPIPTNINIYDSLGNIN